MKIKRIFDEIFSMENLYRAYKNASKNRRYEPEVLEYGCDLWENLSNLRARIYAGNYCIDRYHIFFIQEPKRRMIMSIAFEHRIVQWAIYQVLFPILSRGYIEDSYGCINGRGASGAVKRLAGWMQYVSLKEGDWYYLKLDISKYFYRVPHDKLIAALRRKIHDDRLTCLLANIINCDHTAFGLPRWAKPEDVPMRKRLFTVGMPIGNLMSQLFANLYLDQLDQYCKRKMRIHFYIRSMDDIIILGDSKQVLHAWRDEIRKYLIEELGLDLNSKTCIRPIYAGCEFIGYKFRPGHVAVRRSTTLHIKRSIKAVTVAYAEGRKTLQQVSDSVRSYVSLLTSNDSRAFGMKLCGQIVLRRNDSKARDGPIPVPA